VIGEGRKARSSPYALRQIKQSPSNKREIAMKKSQIDRFIALWLLGLSFLPGCSVMQDATVVEKNPTFAGRPSLLPRTNKPEALFVGANGAVVALNSFGGGFRGVTDNRGHFFFRVPHAHTAADFFAIAWQTGEGRGEKGALSTLHPSPFALRPSRYATQ